MIRNWRTVKITAAATAVVLVFGSGVAVAHTTSRASRGHRAGWNQHTPPQGAFGTVGSVNGSSTSGSCGVAGVAGAFTVTGFRSSTVSTVDVSTTTTFVAPDASTPSFANVCVGDLAGAVGAVTDDTVTATKVFVAPTPTAPRPHGAFGTVASVNGSTVAGTCGVSGAAGDFTLMTWRDTTATTVDVATTTPFVEPGVTTPSFADVCVGGVVGATGTESSDTVTATKIFVAPTPTRTPPGPQGAFGTVASVNGSSTSGSCGVADAAGTFTVTGWRNSSTTTTVDVGTTTTYLELGVSTPTFADVCVGDLVGALGAESSGTVTATKVLLAPAPVPPKLPVAVGTVASVNGSNTSGSCGVSGAAGLFVLTPIGPIPVNAQSTTVDVSTTTTFAAPGAMGSASFAAVCVGDLAAAFGPESSGTVSATNVLVSPAPVVVPLFPGAVGTVASVNGSDSSGSCGVADSSGDFTVSGLMSTTSTVDVSTMTTFVSPGATSPSFAAVCVGDLVAAFGTESSGTVSATKVLVAAAMTTTPPSYGGFAAAHLERR